MIELLGRASEVAEGALHPHGTLYHLLSDAQLRLLKLCYGVELSALLPRNR